MTTAETETVIENELIVLPATNLLTIFTAEDGMDPYLARLRAKIDELKPSLETATSRKAIASFAYKVAQTKVHVDKVGQKLAAEQRKVPLLIDANRRKVWDKLEAWQAEVRKPLTDWEAAEAARTAAHKAEIARIEGLAVRFDGSGNPLPAAALKERMVEIAAIELGAKCQEFLADYAAAKERAIAALKIAVADREKYEAEQAELAQLRAEAAARKAAEDEAARVRAAEDAQRIAAERAPQSESPVAETLAQSEVPDAEPRPEAPAPPVAAVPASIPREPVRATAQPVNDDRAHRARVNGAALAAFMAEGFDQAHGKLIVSLIAQGKIPNVSISYEMKAVAA